MDEGPKTLPLGGVLERPDPRGEDDGSGKPAVRRRCRGQVDCIVSTQAMRLRETGRLTDDRRDNLYGQVPRPVGIEVARSPAMIACRQCALAPESRERRACLAIADVTTNSVPSTAIRTASVPSSRM
jgi:hypothetical protein